ncbi:hypothetical protein QQ045_001772 [Rhodiola kirilowii]
MDSHRPSMSQRPSQAILHPNMDADDIIQLGQIDNSVLSRQKTHRTEAIWNPEVASVRVDPSLLTAAIERWRPETHTFHFNEGEATITLQDVSLLTGLSVEGMPVTGRSQINFEEVIPADADEETLKKYARAYLLNLIGTTLFYEKSGRVARQYGFLQGVPVNAIGCSDECHGMDRKKNRDWGVFHARCIAMWVTRQERLIDGDMAHPGNQIYIPTSQYYEWYATYTCRLIQLMIDDEVEEVGEDDAHQTRPSHAYR